MVSGVQQSQWAVPPSARLKFHPLTQCTPMAQLGLSISLLQERAGVMNPAIQDMADHVAVTDNPKMSVIYMILFLHRTPDSR